MTQQFQSQDKWNYVHTKTCTQIFIEDFFVILQVCMQLKCPLIDQQLSEIWYSSFILGVNH